MKHIRTKIVVMVLAIALLSSVSLGVAAISITRSVTKATVTDVMNETAETVSHNAQNAIATYTTAVSEIATHETFTDPQATQTEKELMVQKKVEQYYMQSGGILNANGVDIFTGEDYSAEPFFQKAMQGETYMSTPYISQEGDVSIVMASPISVRGAIQNVLYFSCDNTILQETVADGCIGITGDCYILDKNGVTIAYGDLSYVTEQSNAIAMAEQNPEDAQLAQLAEVERKMVAGETGFAIYPYNGSVSWQSYLPIESTDGWSLAIVVDEGDVMAQADEAVLIIIGISAAVFFISAIAAFKLGSSISRPIMSCINRLTAMKEGDLSSPMPVVNSSDEIGTFASALEDIIKTQNIMIVNLTDRLGRIAAGNLAFTDEESYYHGDFRPLEISLNEIQERLKGVISDIAQTAEQVSIGASHVEVGAVSLSQTTDQQVDSVEDILSSMKGIQEVSSRISDDADRAMQLTDETESKLNESREYMSRLLMAVNDIQKQSDEISHIIKTIDDIAFQTNILALNAAVEAARAGASGKGFAVVADEVRNLANRSALAAKDTALLIEGSAISTQNVADVAGKTSVALEAVAQHARATAEHMVMINSELTGQNVSIERIHQGVQSISEAIHADSDTSKQSATTSKVLTENAEFLKGMVSTFVVETTPDNQD